MSTLIETIEHESISIEIHVDPDPESPREWTNLGEMVCWHREYDLGDRRPQDWELEALQRGGFPLLERYLQIIKQATVVIPLGLIDHSGLSMYAGGGAHRSDAAGWDSGTVGFIFDTPEKREECGTPPDQIEEVLTAEVGTYNDYLTGQVFCYVVATDGEDSESLCGIYNYEYAVSEARNAATAIARDRYVNEEPLDIAEVLR